jgi:hypothetical protein
MSEIFHTNNALLPMSKISGRPFGVMFHHFKGEGHPDGQGAMTASELEELIHFLGVENILTPSEWTLKVKARTLESQHRCLTFDDNLKCQYDVAKKVLDKYNIKGFWFIYTSPYEGKLEHLEVFRYFRSVFYESVDDFYGEFFRRTAQVFPELEMKKKFDQFKPNLFYSYYESCPFYSLKDWEFRYLRDHVLTTVQYVRLMNELMVSKGMDPYSLKDKLWMSEEEVQRLFSEGHWIGLHSHQHPTLLTSLTYEDQVYEYQKNSEWIERITGTKPKSVSHPCNSYDQRVLDLMEHMGIEIGFRAHLEEDEIKDSSLALPRQDHANLLIDMRT